jgi:hypothetical protein
MGTQEQQVEQLKLVRYTELSSVEARERAGQDAGELLGLMVDKWGYNNTRAALALMSLQFDEKGKLVNTRVF